MRPCVVPLCAATDEENDLLLKVERVINLWCECGKPFAPPALGTYYASGTWNMPRLYNDIAALQKIKTPNSTPGECGQFY